MTILVFLGGVVLGILMTLGGIGIGQALAQRRRELEWRDGMDSLLRYVGTETEKRRQSNDERVLEAARQAIRARRN